jgi:hypothetical protein
MLLERQGAVCLEVFLAVLDVSEGRIGVRGVAGATAEFVDDADEGAADWVDGRKGGERSGRERRGSGGNGGRLRTNQGKSHQRVLLFGKGSPRGGSDSESRLGLDALAGDGSAAVAQLV